MSAQGHRDMQSALWCEINPSKCPCNGRGWVLADWDCWYVCHRHGEGVPHPECEMEEPSGFDYKAHKLANLRDALMTFQAMAVESGEMTAGEFRRAVEARKPKTPEAWVDAAEEVADSAAYAAREQRAQARGFSCGLEMDFADDAAREREDRFYGREW